MYMSVGIYDKRRGIQAPSLLFLITPIGRKQCRLSFFMPGVVWVHRNPESS